MGMNALKQKELQGIRFGRLVATEWIPGNKNKQTKGKWHCICDCGNNCYVSTTDLTSGKTRSCGCLRKETTSIRFKKYAYKDKRLYAIWLGMKSRCQDLHNSSFGNYGGRGISVCDEWKDDFIEFQTWSVKNGYSDKLTIDRVDVDKGYSPENCRWATILEQSRNKTNSKWVVIGQATRTFSEWCEIFQIKYDVAYGRVRWGWTPLKALTTPEGERKHA